MSPSPPLAGVGVLVTRPQSQAQRLMTRIRELGGEPWWLPGLLIEAPKDMRAFARVMDELARLDWLLFVSPTAVERSWPAIVERGGLPPGVRVAAVGSGTRRELMRCGVRDVLAPEGGADSEHLLALPELKEMAGQRVAIFRGEGGRTLLAETLGARGAEVLHAVCYRRVVPDADVTPILGAWREGRIQAVTAFSRESLEGLLRRFPPEAGEALRQTPLFVPHPRIAEHARTLGFARPIATPPGEDGVIQALLEYFVHAAD